MRRLLVLPVPSRLLHQPSMALTCEHRARLQHAPRAAGRAAGGQRHAPRPLAPSPWDTQVPLAGQAQQHKGCMVPEPPSPSSAAHPDSVPVTPGTQRARDGRCLRSSSMASAR